MKKLFVTTTFLSSRPTERGYRATVTVTEEGAVDPIAVATRHAMGDRTEAARLAQTAALEAADEFTTDAEIVFGMDGQDFESAVWKQLRAKREALEAQNTAAAFIEAQVWEQRRRVVTQLHDRTEAVHELAKKLLARLMAEGLEACVNELGEFQSAAREADLACAALESTRPLLRAAHIAGERSFCEHTRPGVGGECGACAPKGGAR